jgi:hypothetical protein
MSISVEHIPHWNKQLKTISYGTAALPLFLSFYSCVYVSTDSVIRDLPRPEKNLKNKKINGL